MEFQNPDFGFNNDLIFEDNSQAFSKYSSNWKYIMDQITLFPRFERVKNYIQFVNEQKTLDEFKKYSKSNPKGNMFGSPGQGKIKKLTAQQQIELMEKIKAERLRASGAPSETKKSKHMTKDQLKYEALGLELQQINRSLTQETRYLKQMKRIARLAQNQYR